ncbi:hypothetical protein SR914_00970 [Comamonas testosteroni]|uniref:Uncharacterized protein n=1 Tax=Comamonas testosteroni (strain DSM 14576 / KF-1) TaxID=399795 RepID=B7WRY7_COMTK|nr:hypothetical protein [Comamonas testosteroni]EED69041.1 conserved hypothetical protein [Comamonas testosteroni KF-1]WQG67030.1 hypothetical protein SR914_00970 [Comamonas testosteroni]
MTSWIAALKLVPWGEVIKATPQVVKAAQGMLKKKEAQAEAREQDASADGARQRISPPASAGEQALLLIQRQEERIAQLEQSQRQSLEIIEKLAQQNAQIVATVGALRIGAQRLAWACGMLGLCMIGLGIYLFSR